MAETKGATVGSLDIILKARQDQLKKDVGEAKKTIQDFAKNVQSLKIDKAIDIGKAIGMSKAGPIGLAAVAVYKLGKATSDQIAETARLTDEQHDLGASLGLSTRNIQLYDNAFTRLGQSVDVGRGGLKGYTSILADLRTGSEDAELTLSGLGLSVEKIQEAGAGGFKETLVQIAKMDTAAEQQAALQKLFPAQAEKLFEVTRLGAKGIEDSFRSVETLSGETTESLTESAKRWRAIGQATRSYFSGITEGISSVAGDVASVVSDVSSKVVGGVVGAFTDTDIDAYMESMKEGGKSVAEIAKTQEANLAIDKQLRAGAREINAYRKDRLKIEQDIEHTYPAADKERKQALVAQQVDKARVQFGGQIEDIQTETLGILNQEAGLRARIARDMQLATKEQRKAAFDAERNRYRAGVTMSQRRAQAAIVGILDQEAGLRKQIAIDMQLATDAQKERAVQIEKDKVAAQITLGLKRTEADIVGLLDKEAGLRRRIAIDMQLATKEQKAQVFEAERKRDGTQTTANFRNSLPGYADRLAQRELINARQRGGMSAAEYNAARFGQQLSKREALGDTITPDERRSLRDQRLRADTSLPEDQRDRALAASQRQFMKEQMEFAASFGKIAGPAEEFRLAVTEIVAQVKDGKLSKTDAARAVSDRYAEMAGPPRMATSLDFGSDAFYRRIGSRNSGYDKKDPNTRVAEYTQRSAKYLESIDKTLAQAIKTTLVGIK